MEHFIQEWKFFNEQKRIAGTEDSLLNCANEFFYNMVVKKSEIVSAPTDDIRIEDLYGNKKGRFFFVYNINEMKDHYLIDLRVNCDTTIEVDISISKKDFDEYLTFIMGYIDGDLTKKFLEIK